MTQALHIGNDDTSRKQTVAELNDLAIVLPRARTISHRGTKVNDHGIPIPTGTMANSTIAGSLTGTYLFGFTFYDPDYDAESAPRSLTSAALTAQTKRFNVRSLTSTNTRVKRIRGYRSLAGGNVLFLALETSTIGLGTASATSTVRFNMSDATISANDTLKIATQAKRVIPRDKYGMAIRHGVRLFPAAPANYYGKMFTSSTAPRAYAEGSITANRVIWSEADSADAFPSDNAVNVGGTDPNRSLRGIGDAIAVFKDNETFLWIYRDDPDGNTGDGSIQNMFTGRGAITFKAAINVDGKLFVMDRRGWYEYGGGQATLDITDEIRPLLERINWAVSAEISGTFDDDRIYWSLPLDGATECYHVLVLDRIAYQANQGAYWWLYYYPMGVRDLDSHINGRDPYSVARGLSGMRLAAAITSNGDEMVLSKGYRDGAHPNWTAEGVTSAAAAKTFRKLGGGLFKSSNIDARGCMVKFDDDRRPDPLLIASATSLTFTLAASLGANIAAGTAYTIGGIKAYWKSPNLDFGTPHDKKNGFGIDLRFVPQGINNRARMKVMADRRGPEIVVKSTTQTGWRATRNKDFVEFDTGGTFASNGRTGFVELPMHSRNWCETQIEIGSSNVDNPWRLSGMVIRQKANKTNR